MESNTTSQFPWIDITVPVTNSMLTWPGDDPVRIKKRSSIDADHDANVTSISMSAHTATHVDAPLHFIENGYDVDSMPLINMIGPVYVLEVDSPEEITAQDCNGAGLPSNIRLIFKTRNSKSSWWDKPFNENFIALSTAAAQLLRNSGVIAVGIDYLSIAPYKNGAEVHRILLEAGISIIEGLDLSQISQGHYEMICLPLRLKNADGAPARVLLRSLENDGTKI